MGICWFLCKNLSNFVFPTWKLHTLYCHTNDSETKRKFIHWKTSCTYWSWLHVWVGVAKSFCTSKFWSDGKIGLRLHYCLEYSLGVSITQAFFRVNSVLQECNKAPTKYEGPNARFFNPFLRFLSADCWKKKDSNKRLALLILTEL